MNGIDAGSEPAAALVAGLAGSGHCLAMCGGIAGALAMRDGGPQAGTHRAWRWPSPTTWRASRATPWPARSPACSAAPCCETVDVAPLSIAFRVLAGVIMIAAAGRLLFGWRLLDPLEAAGAGLWRRMLPGAGGAPAARASPARSAWDWRGAGCPAASRIRCCCSRRPRPAPSGALVMAAFGLGTLPAMVRATVAFERAARALATRATLRNVAGVLLLVFGAWTAGNALYHGLARGGHAGHAMGTGRRAASPADDPHANHQPRHENRGRRRGHGAVGRRRTAARPVPFSRSLDRDRQRPRFLDRDPRQPHQQHTVLPLCMDCLRIDVVRQREARSNVP